VTFLELLRDYDQAIARAEVTEAGVKAAREALALAEAQAEAAVQRQRHALDVASSAAAQAAEAVVQSRDDIHIRLRDRGPHYVKSADGQVTVYSVLADHSFETCVAERPPSGHKEEG
jgi:hypothetical protein